MDPVLCIADTVVRVPPQASGAQRVIGGDQKVAGFERAGQKALQLRHAMQALQAVQARHQNLAGTGGEVDARQRVHAAQKLREVPVVHAVADQRPVPVGPAPHAPLGGVADHKAEVGGLLVVLGEAHPVLAVQVVQQAVSRQGHAAAFEHQTLLAPVGDAEALRNAAAVGEVPVRENRVDHAGRVQGEVAAQMAVADALVTQKQRRKEGPHGGHHGTAFHR